METEKQSAIIHSIYCENSDHDILDHFPDAGKTIDLGNGGKDK